MERFTFIDLFAGIGGFRLAFEELGGKCVFSSEIDKYAIQTYKANFGDEAIYGDITQESVKSQIPQDFDILCGGFPCQAFSIIGHKRGFQDTRGTLFFEIADILDRHHPKAFLLENVKGLTFHNKGNTLKVILSVLRDLGYYVPDPQVLNSFDYGVPQRRNRVYIVGIREDIAGKENFKYPDPVPEDQRKVLRDIIEENPVHKKYYYSDVSMDFFKDYTERMQSKGNGYKAEVRPLDEPAMTITVGGAWERCNIIHDPRITDFTPHRQKGPISKRCLRKFTPRESARVQGFPDTFKIPVSDTRAYKQFGNSVSVPVVRMVGEEILKVLDI